MTVTAGLRRLGPLLLTAALGAAGGALFAWLGLPAAWLAGSMTAVAAAALVAASTRTEDKAPGMEA